MNNEEMPLDKSFDEIDRKLTILSDKAKDWIKMILMTHVTKAYERGKIEGRRMAETP